MNLIQQQDKVRYITNMDSQIFSLPAEMNSVLTATIMDSVNGDILFCHDQLYLYAAKITKIGGSVIFQRFSLPNLIKLIPVIKNYFIALFDNSKLNVFEVGFNEEGKVMLKYVFTKNQRQCVSYFLRQVVQNMAELHVLYPQNDLYICQFTVNGKMGNMDYQLGPQNKILKSERHQLYGSKTIVCPHKKIFYYFTNFSNKFVSSINLAKLQTEMSEQWKTTPFTYVCLPKIQEHYLVLANMMVINVTNPSIKHKIQIDEEYTDDVVQLLQRKNRPSFRIGTYFDMVLIQDCELGVAIVVQIKQKGSCLVAIQYGNFNWFWTATRKLVGFSPSRNSFKMIDNLKKNDKIALNEQVPMEQSKPELPPQFKSANFLKPLRKQMPMQNNEKMNPISPDLIKQILKRNTVPNIEGGPQAKTQEKPVVSEFKEEPFISTEKSPDKFVPTKIIQKKGVNQSKTINKPKEIKPMMSAEAEEKKQLVLPPEQPSTVIVMNPKVIDSKDNTDDPDTNDLINQQERQILDILQASSPDKPFAPKKQSEMEDLSIESQQKVEKLLQNTSQINELSADHWKEPNEQVKEPKEGSNDQEEKKQNQQKKEEKTVQVQQQELKPEDKQSMKEVDDNLYKNLSILMQKRSIGAIDQSYSQIDRNKIFQASPKRSQSLNEQQDDLYNPLTSSSPLQVMKQDKVKDVKEERKQEEKQDEAVKLQNKEDEKQEASAVVNQQSTQITVQAKNDEAAIVQQAYQQPIKKKENNEEEPYNIQIKDHDIQDQQQRNEYVLSRIKQLFQETTVKLTKTLDQVAESSSIEPYLKKGVVTQIQQKVMSTLRKSITGQFATKIELFFKELFRQTSQVQQESVIFYKEVAQHKSGLIEVQLSNQQKILKDVKEIQNMIRVSISSLRNQSQEISQNLIREWRSEMKDTQKIVDSLQTFKIKMEEEAQKRSKRYDQTKKQLQLIRKMLQDRVNEEQQRKQKELEEQSLKLQQLEQMKKAKAKKKHKKNEPEKEKKVRIRRVDDV